MDVKKAQFYINRYLEVYKDKGHINNTYNNRKYTFDFICNDWKLKENKQKLNIIRGIYDGNYFFVKCCITSYINQLENLQTDNKNSSSMIKNTIGKKIKNWFPLTLGWRKNEDK